MTGPDPVLAFDLTSKALGHRYRLERLVAASEARLLFEAFDESLQRRVSLRANFYTDEPTRAWFLREAEALGQLDHPAIRHVYDTGITGSIAYRVGNWIEGESLEEAVARGPRIIPTVIALARDMLGALEHAHMQGIVMRRIVPATVLVGAERAEHGDGSAIQQLHHARRSGEREAHRPQLHGARDP